MSYNSVKRCVCFCVAHIVKQEDEEEGANRLARLRIITFFHCKGDKEGQKAAFGGWTGQKGRGGSPVSESWWRHCPGQQQQLRVHTRLCDPQDTPPCPGQTRLLKEAPRIFLCFLPPQNQKQCVGQHMVSAFNAETVFLFPRLMRKKGSN